MDDLDTPQFALSDACRASRIEPNTVRAWLSRGHLVLGGGDLKASANGKAHTISRRRVYQIAISAELASLGIPPRRASMLAAGFSDVGNGEGDPDNRGGERLPGCLYEGDRTWLIAQGQEETSRIVRVSADISALGLLASLTEAAVILPLDIVIRRVERALANS